MLSTSSSTCSSFLGTSSSTNRLCAWAKGTDTCQGDSGGPLTVAEGGKYTLLGVVSYGAGCASSTPGIYARVQGFLPWIQSLISSGECSTGSSTATTSKPTKPTSGTFSSKNFPGSYPTNFDETKTIEVDSGRKIKVKFTAFSLEQGRNCVWDYLQVRPPPTPNLPPGRSLMETAVSSWTSPVEPPSLLISPARLTSLYC